MIRRCPKCGAKWEKPGRIGAREECPECAAFLHTCANCVHYDAALKGCRLPSTETVRDREGINFCEEFEFGVPGTAPAEPGARPGAAPGPAGPPARHTAATEAEARRRFEDLFRDKSS